MPKFPRRGKTYKLQPHNALESWTFQIHGVPHTVYPGTRTKKMCGQERARRNFIG